MKYLGEEEPVIDAPLSTKYLWIAFGSAFFLPMIGFIFGIYTLCKGKKYLTSALAILAVSGFSFFTGLGPALLMLAVVQVMLLF